MRKINKDETMRRMELAAIQAMESDEKATPICELDDHDIIMVFGSMIMMQTNGIEMDFGDITVEIVNRAKKYAKEMMDKENLIVYEEDQHET